MTSHHPLFGAITHFMNPLMFHTSTLPHRTSRAESARPTGLVRSTPNRAEKILLRGHDARGAGRLRAHEVGPGELLAGPGSEIEDEEDETTRAFWGG